MAEELIQMKVVHGLMVAVGNLDHVVSQRYASISLEVSMVGHHSMGSAPMAPEEEGSLQFWGFSLVDWGFCLSIAGRLIHKGRSDTSFREELYFHSCHSLHTGYWKAKSGPSHLCSSPRLAKGLTKTICLEKGYFSLLVLACLSTALPV